MMFIIVHSFIKIITINADYEHLQVDPNSTCLLCA